MTLETILFALGAALLGWLAGVVVNALADDLPFRNNPSLPHYPNGAPRPLSAWSGIFAFLTGQRDGPAIQYSESEEKARGLSLEEIADLAYDTRLSWRHPFTEIGLAGLFALMAVYPFDYPRLAAWFILVPILVLITVIDLEHRLVLFIVIVPSLMITLILNALVPEKIPTGDERPFTEYLYGALLGGGVFFIMYLGGGVFADFVAMVQRRALSEVAFGFGDVMLAFLCGLILGWRVMIFAMFITVFAGAAGAILYMGYRLVAGKRYRMYTPLPYGPYIVFGTLIMMLFLDEVREFFR